MASPGNSSTSRGDFPYHIPGPAGSDYGAISEGFTHNTWHSFLIARELKPYGKNTLDFSISQLISKALRKEFSVVSLAARVSYIRYPDDEDATQVKMTLHDATGFISATAPLDALDERKIREGSVIVLKEVLPVLHLAYVTSAQRLNFGKCVGIVINPANIAGHYPPSTPSPSSFKPLTLSVYENCVVTDREAHVSLLKDLRDELLGMLDARKEERVRKEKERRGVIARPGSRNPRSSRY